jgi:hypothetical protein
MNDCIHSPCMANKITIQELNAIAYSAKLARKAMLEAAVIPIIIERMRMAVNDAPLNSVYNVFVTYHEILTTPTLPPLTHFDTGDANMVAEIIRDWDSGFNVKADSMDARDDDGDNVAIKICWNKEARAEYSVK